MLSDFQLWPQGAEKGILIPTQYVGASLLAPGNYGDAARLTHHTELPSMGVCSCDSPA